MLLIEPGGTSGGVRGQEEGVGLGGACACPEVLFLIRFSGNY